LTRCDRPLKLFLTYPKAAPVFAIGPPERLASLSCVRPFRPVLHEAATAAAPARTSLWSPDLQPHPPPLHICALTAEDILIEHSSKATGAGCCGYRNGTAFSAVAPRERPACSQSAHRNNSERLSWFQARTVKACGPAQGSHRVAVLGRALLFLGRFAHQPLSRGVPFSTIFAPR
jgi:hypothetical protein